MQITITFDRYILDGACLNARADFTLPDSATWGQVHEALEQRLNSAVTDNHFRSRFDAPVITSLNGESVMIGYSGLPHDAQILPLLESGKQARAAHLQSFIDANLEREAQAVLMAEWARATGRTGGGHKQSRQGKARKLRAHGTKSDYAAKMRADIAAANA